MLTVYTSHIPHPSYITSSHSSSHHFQNTLCLLSNANDTASGTEAGIARGLTQLVSALTQIISASMHNDRSAQDALRPDQLDLLVRDGALGVSLAVGFEVAEVADVAFAVGGGAVGLGEGVEMRSSASATIGVVTELVDVHAALGGGIVATHVVRDGRWGGLGRLLKGDGSADFGVTAENCDCFNHCESRCVCSGIYSIELE